MATHLITLEDRKMERSPQKKQFEEYVNAETNTIRPTVGERKSTNRKIFAQFRLGEPWTIQKEHSKECESESLFI